MSKRKYRVEDVTLREVNTSKKYYTGSRWQMKSGEWITVEGQCTIKTPTCKGRYIDYKHFLISFPQGYRCITLINCISERKIKNPYTPIVYGVGFMGEGEYVSSINKIKTPMYSLWCAMLQRCYDPLDNINFITYKDCTVDPRWHNFQNFCEDIQFLEGYAEWKTYGAGAYHLDKDLLQQGVKNKVYSRKTCVFLSAHDNLSEMAIRCNLTGKTYIAHRLSDNYKEEFTNQTNFALKYDLCQGHITSCTKGSRKTHKGWAFQIKEEESNG